MGVIWLLLGQSIPVSWASVKCKKPKRIKKIEDRYFLVSKISILQNVLLISWTFLWVEGVFVKKNFIGGTARHTKKIPKNSHHTLVAIDDDS